MAKRPILKPKTKKVKIGNREVEVPVNEQIQDKSHEKLKIDEINEGKAVISVSLGITVNMGDYESARLDLSLKKVVDDEDDEISQNFQAIYQMLEDEIVAQQEQISELF